MLLPTAAALRRTLRNISTFSKTLAEVTSAAYDGKFTRNPVSELDLNFTRSAYWLRIRVLNHTPEHNWYMRLPGSLSRQGELFVRTGDDVTQPLIPQPRLPRFKESIYYLPLVPDMPYMSCPMGSSSLKELPTLQSTGYP